VPKPYEQKPGEPDLWYGRFHEFLLQGSRRSLLSVYNAEREKAGKGGMKSVPSAWDEAANQWRWRERATFWDAEARLRDQQVWQLRREEFRQRQWRLAERLLERAEEMLEKPLTGIDREGNPYERWNFRDIATFISEGTRLSRQAADLWEGDLNSALAMVDRYYEQLPEAIAAYRQGMMGDGIPEHGIPEYYKWLGDPIGYAKAIATF
jgi:hypothetical protein